MVKPKSCLSVPVIKSLKVISDVVYGSVLETKSKMRNLGVDASLTFDHFALLKYPFFISEM